MTMRCRPLSSTRVYPRADGAGWVQGFSSRTRILYEYVTEHEIRPSSPPAPSPKEPFVVYCSGSDEAGLRYHGQNRSDVNVLAVVNPTTRQILLVNTPRDYYLPLAHNGEMDKLTHAGLYGVQETMAVLDNPLRDEDVLLRPGQFLGV